MAPIYQSGGFAKSGATRWSVSLCPSPRGGGMISHSRGGFVPVMTMVYFQRPPRHHRQHEHRRAAVEHAKRPAVARARRMLDVAREADCLAPRRLIVWERFACRVGVGLLALEMEKIPRHVWQCEPRDYGPGRADRPRRQRSPSTSPKCFLTAALHAQALTWSAGGSRIRMAPRRVARMRRPFSIWMTRLA